MFYGPPQKWRGPPEIEKSPPPLRGKWGGVPPPLCRESGGGDFLKYPGDDKMGQFLGHFCIYEGSKSQKFSRATRARAYIHGYMTSLNETAPLIRHKNGYMQKNGRFGGISGFCPKILPEIENFGGGAPPPFCQTPYKTLIYLQIQATEHVCLLSECDVFDKIAFAPRIQRANRDIFARTHPFEQRHSMCPGPSVCW